MQHELSKPFDTTTTLNGAPKETTAKIPQPPPVPTPSPKLESEKSPSDDLSTCDSASITYDADDRQFWANRWLTATPDEECLFTRGRVTTMKQWYQRLWFHLLCEQLDDDFGGDHVEFGAGRATTSMYMAMHTPCVTLVDQCEEGFHIAKANFEKHGLPVPTMRVADVRDSGLPSDYYASCYSIGLLEHIKDPTPAIAETYRILKPGGVMFHVVVELTGGRSEGHRYCKGTKFYLDAAEQIGFKDAQAIEELRKGLFILTAKK